MSSRALLVVFASSWLSVLSGCGSDPGALIPCGPGLVCPGGSECAARQPVCIQDACGDLVVDPGEACDDGGITDGDVIDGRRCSADCTSDETCGNHHVDAAVGEVCDPPGAACSADCRSSLTCGNHTVDEGEECDPGADGVPLETAICDLNCTRARCGDGIRNESAGEQCDRMGDGVPGTTGESTTCNADCTMAVCGDGLTNPLAGEQCDFGPNNAFDGACLPSCKSNVCGDGHVNTTLVAGRPVEDCDSGPQDAVSRTACPYGEASCVVCSVCKMVNARGAYCGDGTRDLPFEACDDGNNVTETACPAGQTTCTPCSADCARQITIGSGS